MAADNARHIREQQVSGPTAIAFLEQVWGADLSAYDPDGPLPDVEPVENPTITRGRVRHGDRLGVAVPDPAAGDGRILDGLDVGQRPDRDRVPRAGVGRRPVGL
ncbi:hypothetical protein MAHJHV55_52600 [Mycobacterium avium subsp. hominissuis]